MDNKFYVSLEAARLLKEKGYNEEVELFYNTLGELEEVNGMFCCDVADNTQMAKYDYLSAPTKAEAIDWLESKGIVVELRYENDELQKDDSEWEYYIYQYDNEGRLDETVSSWGMGMFYDTRLEAEEAAIIKALELL